MSKWEIVAWVIMPLGGVIALIYPGYSIAKMAVSGAIRGFHQLHE